MNSGPASKATPPDDRPTAGSGSGPTGGESGGRPEAARSPRRLAPLVILVLALMALRLGVHALYVPVFEGPDEPFHLSRIAAFLSGSWSAGWAGDQVDPAIAGAVRAHECGADLARAFGCPPFGESGNPEFNGLDSRRSETPLPGFQNYEAHQPPLYYLCAVLPVGTFRALSSRGANPVSELLLARLFSVALVLLAVFGPIRAVAGFQADGDSWLAACAMLLLLPGASESLARCANDAGVFAWTAVVIWCIHRSKPTGTICLLLLVGPLIKLTALPVVAFAIVWLLVRRPWWHAAGAALASSPFVAVQYARGYLWGGTVELNASRGVLDETAAQTVVGLVRSVFTLLKTTVWLGEWSFFRAPHWLLALVALFVLLVVPSVRRVRGPDDLVPHVVSLGVAAILVVAFFFSHRLLWNQWGGVGGWYLWGWFPWLAFTWRAFFRIAADQSKRLFWALGILVGLANVSWFYAAHSLYGH